LGNQVLISSHRKLLRLTAVVVNVAETSGHAELFKPIRNLLHRGPSGPRRTQSRPTQDTRSQASPAVARAASGHAAAPPNRDMNSRRLMAFPEAQDLPTATCNDASTAGISGQ
jgi:hypothetical protein